MLFELIDRALHRVHHATTTVEEIAKNVRTIMTKISDLNQRIDDLTAQVAKNVEVEQSALVLIQGINAELTAAGTDADKLDALRSKLVGSAEALSQAVAANTASPAAPPAPAPETPPAPAPETPPVPEQP